MKIGETLHFSPNVPFADLKGATEDEFVAAFRDRITGFYLNPVHRLVEAGDAFAAGLLCCASIEVIATFLRPEDPRRWLKARIADFSDYDDARDFWDYFRHGLAHEGRIKGLGQFSLDQSTVLTHLGALLVIDPGRLLSAVEEAFADACDRLDDAAKARLVRRLNRYHNIEIEAAAS